MKLEMIVARYAGDTGEVLRVDPARCTARGACWNACPTGAVLFGEPSGGTGVRFTHG